MRHARGYRRLNRTHEHRKALWANMAGSLIEHEQIKTTLPKAKELRGFVEPLITLAKVDSVANRRRAFSKLRMDSIVNKLFTEIAVKSKDRPGGYLRIIKAGFRPGDKADMAYVEWVDRSMDDNGASPEPQLKEESAA